MKKLVLGSVLSAAMLVTSACGGGSSDEITIGAQTYTDPKIIAHMVEALVEDQTDHEVKIIKDISASPQIISAMDQNEIQIATLYSGEVYNNHFGKDEVQFTTDPDKTLEQAQKLFNEKFNFTWFDSLGFQNKYTIAIRGDLAEKNNIKTMSDLAPFADQLRLGTDSTWLERPNDGYRAFAKHYGYQFKDPKGMEVQLMYTGVENNELDVVTAYSVDPQIIELDLKMLEDDKAFFPPFSASLVARNDMLEKYPDVKKIIESLTNTMDEETMTKLIYEVDINKRDEKEVALEYLKEKGLLK